MIVLFSITIFTSAFLLFLIQPMVGKLLLPFFGGTPGVWNVCMLFFQAILLLGYLYAHLVVRLLQPRITFAVHSLLLLVGILIFPLSVHFSEYATTQQSETSQLLTLLLTNIGFPLFLISTSAPLLQMWFSSTTHKKAADPYFLYAASNFGSLLALIAFPLFLEPSFSMYTLSANWRHAFTLYAIGTFVCAYVSVQSKQAMQPNMADNSDDASRITLKKRFNWIFCAFVPSSLMLGVTTKITTDIASVPLLWIIPLTLYLLSFIIAFSSQRSLFQRVSERILPFALAVIIPFVFTDVMTEFTNTRSLVVFLHFFVFFLTATACHSALSERRPAVSHLTEFYFWVSFGGVLGGLANAIVAPSILNNLIEYPLVLALVYFCLPKRIGGQAWRRNDYISIAGVFVCCLVISFGIRYLDIFQSNVGQFVTIALPLLLIFHLKRRGPVFGTAFLIILFNYYFLAQSSVGTIQFQGRNFFGVKKVLLDNEKNVHTLIHGGTNHGMEKLHNPNRVPSAYFHPSGPVGEVFQTLGNISNKTAIVGLGIGATAYYARPDDHFHFLEIDPMVVEIAQNPDYFTYLSTCRGRCSVQVGDGRLLLKDYPADSFGLIFLDAFSSDAIPAHLLTTEAISMYLEKLATPGALLFQISNRYVSLENLLGNTAASLGLVAFRRADGVTTRAQEEDGKTASNFLIMARDRASIEPLLQQGLWRRVQASKTPVPWTDDYSNLLNLLHW